MSELITNAAVLREAKKPLSFEELTIDSPQAGEVRIQLRSCGVCHTDYSLAKGILDHQPIPSVLGHEGSGVIIDVGPGVTNVKVGDHVKKGDVIGTVGETGRATGPHLDIRLNWYDVRLDPATVLNIK